MSLRLASSLIACELVNFEELSSIEGSEHRLVSLSLQSKKYPSIFSCKLVLVKKLAKTKSLVNLSMQS